MKKTNLDEFISNKFENISEFIKWLKSDYKYTVRLKQLEKFLNCKSEISIVDDKIEILRRETDFKECAKCRKQKRPEQFKWRSNQSLFKYRGKICYKCVKKPSKKTKVIRSLKEYIENKNCPLRIENQWSLICMKR